MKIVSSLILFALCLGAQDRPLTQLELKIQDAIQASQLAEADRLIENALTLYPKDGGLFNLRGVVHAQQTDLSAAKRDFEQAVHFAPALTAAWQNLARTCQMLPDQNACAINSWQHVLQLKAVDMEARSSLAFLYEKDKNYWQSLRELDRLAPEPGNLAIRCADLILLGRLAEAKTAASRLAANPNFSDGDLDNVRAALETPRAATAVAILVEALDARQGASLQSLRMLAVAYEQLARPADARKMLERVAIMDPKNTAHLLELARLADASKDYEGAIGYLAHARDLDPDNARIHFLYAMTAEKMNLPIEARKSLDRALQLEPDNADCNYAMGSVILTTRDAATASTYFQKFVKAKPDEPQGHYALGIAYFASGDFDKAREEMLRVEAQPKTAAGAEFLLGRIARLDGSLDDALTHLAKSIKLMPGFSESHTELGRVYLLQGNTDEAAAELRRAVELDPESFRANEQLLVLYKRTHDSRAGKQAELLQKLDEERSKRAELMLRTIETRP